MRRKCLFLLVIICLVTCATVSQAVAAPVASSITRGNAYFNPTLGIRVVLPGKWHFTRQSTTEDRSEAVTCPPFLVQG